MRGKYSPTVEAAYKANQYWWKKYAGQCLYDPEGFDCYGYDMNDIDRAGHAEHVYYESDEFGENWRYNQALEDWGFDGVKPVRRA